MCSTKSYLSLTCVERARIAEFLLNTSANTGFGAVEVPTSGGSAIDAFGFSFKSNGTLTDFFSHLLLSYCVELHKPA